MSSPVDRPLLEITWLWLTTLLFIRLVVEGVQRLGLPEVVHLLVPLAFVYAPVLVCRWRGVDSWSYPLAIPAFRDGAAWWAAIRASLMVILPIFPPFLLGYHLWHSLAFGHRFVGTWPEQSLLLIGYHLFFVAIPEEIFYRGYMQSRLDEVYGKPWRIFGVELGWGWILTCLLFAFGHSLVQFQWWHGFIFFPSLIFGWLRARTGDVTAGALFHAWSNVTVTHLDTLYGVIPP